MNEFLKSVRDLAVPYGSAALWWLGQMGLLVKLGETVLCVDYFASEDPGRQVPPPVPAAEMEGDGLRLVLATPGTLSSEKYARLYARFGRNAVSLPCPGLMDFVEAGDRGSPALRDYLRTLFAPYLDRPVTAVVLGCTHYSFIRSLVASYFPGTTQVMDGNAGTVRQLRRVLDERGQLNPGMSGAVSLSTSGSDETLGLMRKMFEEAKQL